VCTHNEGTGIRPDYLANRADQKIEGPPGKKIARKSRNGRRARGGEVGAEGMVTKGAMFVVLELNTNNQRISFLQNAFALTSIALTLVPLGTKLLEISAQFLIGSPSNLPATPTVHSTTISRFPCNFSPEWPLIFFVSMIHQVIWPIHQAI